MKNEIDFRELDALYNGDDSIEIKWVCALKSPSIVLT